MATSSGFQAAGSRTEGPIKTAVQEWHQGGTVAVMAQLSLARNHPHRHVKAPVSTWGQIKSLTDNGQAVLQRYDKPVTAQNLFLITWALLSVTSAEAISYSYWAYIPNPPLLEPVMWGASLLLVYTTPVISSLGQLNS